MLNRHDAEAGALAAVREQPLLKARRGSTEEVAEPSKTPRYEHNEDWDEVRLDEDMAGWALRFTDLGAQWETAARL